MSAHGMDENIYNWKILNLSRAKLKVTNLAILFSDLKKFIRLKLWCKQCNIKFNPTKDFILYIGI